MKKLFNLVIFLSLLFLTFSKLNSSTTLKKEPSPAPSSSPSSLTTIKINGQTYAYDFFKIEDLNNLNLYLNLNDKLSSQELIKKHHCQSLINGNFYDQSDKPLGLFIQNHQILYPAINSQLFNGFFSIGDQPNISTAKPINPRLAIQSGPLLFVDQTPLTLKINQDESRRRSVALINNNHQLFFFTILKLDSSYQGPLLENLPTVLKAISNQENISVESAINLDGGTASVFLNQNTYLKEFSTVGSVFCLN